MFCNVEEYLALFWFVRIRFVSLKCIFQSSDAALKRDTLESFESPMILKWFYSHSILKCNFSNLPRFSHIYTIRGRWSFLTNLMIQFYIWELFGTLASSNRKGNINNTKTWKQHNRLCHKHVSLTGADNTFIFYK